MNSNDLSVQNRCWMMAVASKAYTVWLKSVSGTDRRRLTQIRQQLRNDRVHGGRQNADQVLATIQPVSLGVPKPCRWCTAHLWPFESRIRVTPCCANGNYVIPTELIPRVHPELRAMYQDPMFIKHCRRINALLSFTAIGTSPSRQQQGRGLYSLPFPSVVRMEGKSYHLMVPASIPGPLHFYFVSDPSSTTDPRLAGSKLNPVDQQQVSFMAHRVRTWIEGNHILKDALQQMSEVGTHLLSYLDVVFVLGSAAESGLLSMLQLENSNIAMVVNGFSDRSVEIAAIVSASDSRINCRRDAVVFFRTPEAAHACGITADKDGRYFIHNQSAQYESLQFVLLYPQGTGGWYCLPPKRSAEDPTVGPRDRDGALIAFREDAPLGGEGGGANDRGQARDSLQQQDDANGDHEDGEQLYADLDEAGDEELKEERFDEVGGNRDENDLEQEEEEVEPPAVPVHRPAAGATAPNPVPTRAKSKWKRSLSTAGKPFTLFTFLKCLIFQCVLLAALPRLGQEYLLDGYSRWQEITLAAVQNQKAVKFSTTRRAAFASAGRGDPIGTPLPTVMPSSVPGSQRYQQTLIENGMAIISKDGKPTFWITMTCNPLWPEFGSMTPKECEYWESTPERRTEMLATNEVARDRVDLQVGRTCCLVSLHARYFMSIWTS
jgi:hypothetical protein